jgi:hypothetical protein
MTLWTRDLLARKLRFDDFVDERPTREETQIDWCRSRRTPSPGVSISSSAALSGAWALYDDLRDSVAIDLSSMCQDCRESVGAKANALGDTLRAVSLVTSCLEELHALHGQDALDMAEAIQMVSKYA